jgi:outer membrane receptor for ferrienterochelin and colicin
MDYRKKKLKKNTLASSLAIVLGMTFAVHVSAQQASAKDEEKKEESAEGKKKLDSVQVVGSRIKRTEIEGPSPVTIITREDIEREGFDTVADVLGSLTQNTSNSFTGELAVTGFTPNAQVINLRSWLHTYTGEWPSLGRLSAALQPR